MKASRHPELGRVVATVIKASCDMLEDPMNDYAGFTPDPTPHLEEIVQAEGFANLHHFVAVVRRRTSHRYVYFNLHSC